MEYGLLVSLICLAIIGAYTALVAKMDVTYAAVASAISAAIP